MRTIGFDLTFISSSNLVGSSKFIQRLLKEIMRGEYGCKYIFYLQKGIDAALFNIDESRADVEIVRVPRLVGRVKRILFQQTLFYGYLRKSDVIYNFCTYLPLFCRAKKIITLHDMLPFAFTKKHSLMRRLFIVDFTKLIARRAAHIVTVSQNSKNDIIKYLGKEESDITVISNFIGRDEAVIKGEKAQDGTIETKEGLLRLQKPYICTVSSLQPGKNLANLIRGFAEFHRSAKVYHLYLCGGKGWGYQELFDLVKELEMGDFIHFTGYVADEELDKVYSGCEAVAYVSYFEGFGIPPLEGFLHGKPCVASNTTSLPEVVGDAGVYVDPYDYHSIASGLKEVTENPGAYTCNVRVQADKFRPEVETRKFIDLLNKI